MTNNRKMLPYQSNCVL